VAATLPDGETNATTKILAICLSTQANASASNGLREQQYAATTGATVQ
jgi:hypothetical protein